MDITREMETVLRMTGTQHGILQRHLYPGDGREAVAVALCGRLRGNESHILTVREIQLIPHASCTVRTPDRIEWPTALLEPLLVKAMKTDGAILKIHSHPGGFAEFSRNADDIADRELFASIYGWTDSEAPHVSCVMLPEGRVFGRTVTVNGEFRPVKTVVVAGADLHFWHHNRTSSTPNVPEFAVRHAQAFGAGTFNTLQNLSIAVVGCSGTGSPVIEMLARLGVGKLVIVDPDNIEEKNLNRILNATDEDARHGELKVEVLARAVRNMGTGTIAVPIAKNLYDREVVKAVAECDVVFGCMDSIDGRHLLNKIAVYYLLPYFDLGVKLIADGVGGVEQICGTVHYLQPDGSSLLSRGTYTQEQFAAASLSRANPNEYEKRLKDKYIVGVAVERPAIISVNMLVASLGVNELLARLHSFRDEGNSEFATTRISLTQVQTYYEAEGDVCPIFEPLAGRGDVEPLLDLTELSETYAAGEMVAEEVNA